MDQDAWYSMENRFFGNTARGYDQTRKNRGIALDDVYVVSPSFLVNFRYGLTHQEWTEKRLSNGLDLASLGFSSNLVALAEKPSALPSVSVSPFDQLGSWASGDGVGTGQSHSFTLNLTKLRGNHNLRFGTDFRIYRQNRNQNPTAISPTLSFNSTYTRGPLDSSAAPSIGGEITSFLLGVPSGSMDRVASSAEQDKFFALYVQDDFKLSSRVNLNFGLRYEYETPVTERFDRSVAHFAFDQSSPIEAAARANYAAGTQIPELPLNQFYLRGGLTYVNTGGNPRSYWESEKRNFMPRFGISFQVDPKTILRGGYGIFFDTVGVNNTSSIQTGYSQTTPIQASLDSGLTFIATTANPFPNGLIAPLGSSGGLSTNLGQSISFFPARRRHPYSQRWSLGLQRALPGQFVVEASYVGNRATRINVSRDINALPIQYLSTSGTRDAQTINYLSQSFANPLYGTNSIYGTNTSRGSILRPYPQFGSVTVLDPVGYSWYHALQVRAEKRLSHGYTMQLSYTWSKTMDATEFLNAGRSWAVSLHLLDGPHPPDSLQRHLGSPRGPRPELWRQHAQGGQLLRRRLAAQHGGAAAERPAAGLRRRLDAVHRRPEQDCAAQGSAQRGPLVQHRRGLQPQQLPAAFEAISASLRCASAGSVATARRAGTSRPSRASASPRSSTCSSAPSV